MCIILLNTYLNDMTGSIMNNIRVVDMFSVEINVILTENMCFYLKNQKKKKKKKIVNINLKNLCTTTLGM